MPLHVRLVLVNGLVFAAGVLVMSMAPAHHGALTAVLVLAGGLGLIVAVNTRHLRQSLATVSAGFGALRQRWEEDRRASDARGAAAREYDGQRMAEVLHDGVGDNLSAALVGLKKAIAHAPPELAEELRRVQRSTQLGLVAVHTIGRGLRPEQLEDMGLHSALLALVAQLAEGNRGTEVHRHLEGPFDLGAEAELVVYRVAEESLRNIARHARARNVEVFLRREDGCVALRVTDDGVGIGHNGARAGILGMRERAALIGGELTVRDRATGGTEVVLRVPRRA